MSVFRDEEKSMEVNHGPHRLKQDKNPKFKHPLPLLFDYGTGFILEMDSTGNVITCSDNQSLLGYQRNEVTNFFSHLIVKEHADIAYKYFKEGLSGISKRFSVEAIHKNGFRKEVEMEYIPLLRDGTITQVFAALKETHNEKKMKDENTDRNRFVNIMNSVEAGIWSMILPEKKISFVSRGLQKICGYAPEEIINGQPNWEEIIYHEDMLKYKEIKKKLKSGKVIRQQYRIVHKSGDIKWISDQRIPLLNEEGELIRIDGIVSDVTDQKVSEERMTYYAYHDYLTGLPNHRMIDHEITRLIETYKKSESEFAVMYLDVDRFKHVNDTLGYLIGDELLKLISNRIKACITSNDILARMSGNEFIILITSVSSSEKLLDTARTILKSMEEPVSIQGYELYITASTGISVYPSNGTNAEEIIRNADAALSRAKAFGKNNYQLYIPTMNNETYTSFILEKDLRAAISREELHLLYQPRVDTRTSKIVGAEALIRWKHPDWGLISPGEFIPLAEKSDLIIEVGDWVIREVCRQIKEWQSKGLSVVPVSINIVARRFMKQNWIETVLQTLKNTQVNPCLIELEITENSLIQNEKVVLDAIFSLKKAGIKLALDDFGTGFSSITYLKQFRFDTIKIDRSFIRDVCTSEEDATITKAIIQLAQGLDMNVVAEGVETIDQLAFLHEHGCCEIQGFLYSKPVGKKELENMLINRTLHPYDYKIENT